MENFLARQPILNQVYEIEAYELLFRSGLVNHFDHPDGDHATGRVIADSILLFDIESMTGGVRAFINFTRKLLVEDYALSLPKEQVVVEILENIDPDPEVVTACRRLKDKGYRLALDDFVYQPRFEPLVELADIIKVDFVASPARDRLAMAQRFRPLGITLLAEKVETWEDMNQATEMGYQLFQGYFFSKPVIVSRRGIPGVKTQCLRLLKEVNKPEAEVSDIAKVISSDVALSFKLLRYINSAAFMLRNEVTSIQQAIVLLGMNEVRRWSNLLALSTMGSEEPAQILVTSLVRARLAELAAPLAGLGSRGSEAFLLGLFSLLDAIFGRPLAEVLGEINLSQELQQALLGQGGKLGQLLDLVVAQEKGDWPTLSRVASEMGVPEDQLAPLYQKAVLWQADVWDYR